MIKIKHRNAAVNYAKNAINHHQAFWEEIAQKYDVTVETIKKYVRESYPTKKKLWKDLCQKEKENHIIRQKLAEVLPDPSDVQEVILADTGFLMDKGIKWIMDQSLDIYVSEMTVRELDTLSNSYQIARDLLSFYWSTRRLICVDLNGKEELYVEPHKPLKKSRTRNIVAVAVRLDKNGKKVRLYSNSYAVVELAEFQDTENINAIYVASDTQ